MKDKKESMFPRWMLHGTICPPAYYTLWTHSNPEFNWKISICNSRMGEWAKKRNQLLYGQSV